MPARRIVSLVPSQTELLYDLGLDDEVVGITKFCVHPEKWRNEKTIVGGTKNLDHEVVDSLKPDLIIANKEENTREDVEFLMKKYKVWVSDVGNIEDAYDMMSSVAKLTGTNASGIITEIKDSFSALRSFEAKRSLYLIWKKPWMTAGIDTFIHSMMKLGGFENVVGARRYPELSDEEMRKLDPEVVLLSSEPYPFKGQHVEEIQKMLPAAKVVLVDGEMFSWYGSRMREAAGYIDKLRLEF
jgi:ABC-type Fe3+-hydroxamate transport system substrate-binding protein